MKSTASALGLLLVCMPLTIGAVWAFPLHDDAWLWLLLKESGPGVIVRSVADRPVMAVLWWLLAGSETAFWRASFLAQALLWPLLGIISALLWTYLCPGLRRYAMVVACVTVAPILSKVQMITTNIALGQLLSVVLGYVAALLLLRFIMTEGRLGWVTLALSVPVLGLGILITEYAIPTAIVMLILFWSHGIGSDPVTRRRGWQAVLLVTVVAFAAYLTYLLLSDPSARPGGGVHPSYLLALGVGGLVRFPFKFVSAMWQILARGFMTTMADVSLTSVANIAGVAYGALVAGLLLYGSREAKRTDSSSEDAIDGRSLLRLVMVFGAGLAPLVAMARVPWNPGDAMSSRFALPLLPITAALAVFISLRIIRPQVWAIPILLFGFLAGYATFTEAWSAIRERQQMSIIGKALASHVSLNGGNTVAAVALPERSLGPRRPYELTARLTATWPAELRRTFWAYRVGGGPPLYQVDQEAEGVFGSRGSCTPPRHFKSEVRLVTREGPLDRLIWVAPRADGSISVEAYCIGDPAAAGHLNAQWGR